jgi:hypothetical protein
VAKPIYEPRIPSFWSLQIGGWLLYGVAIAAASIPFRHDHEYVAYRGMFLLSGFVESFVMYALCHVLWSKRVPLFRALLSCAGLSYLLGTLCSAASVWAEIHLGGSKMEFRWASVFAGSTGGSFVLVAWGGFYFGIKHYQALEEQRLKLLASESLAREAQLRALRYQLQPHFLFNTLNAISTLVLDNQPRVATQMIAKLGDLLRSTLDAPDTHQVSLAEEIAVAEEYLAIEEVRFGARLSVSFKIAPKAREAQVPRFLLQPLVENAIRQGVSKRREGGQIAIRASALDGDLRIEVENEGIQTIGMDAPDLTDQGRGLGLANTRARLDQLYGSAATLNTRTRENGNFEVSISIPLSISEQATAPRLEESSL